MSNNEKAAKPGKNKPGEAHYFQHRNQAIAALEEAKVHRNDRAVQLEPNKGWVAAVRVDPTTPHGLDPNRFELRDINTGDRL